MNNAVFGILAESPLHPGSGKTTGAVDLPVAREVTTQLPVVVGSSFKGALRQEIHTRNVPLSPAAKKDLEAAFGTPNHAGWLLVSDAALLLLPVRSLSGMFFWVTCPLILERFQRVLHRAGLKASFAIPQVGDKKMVLASTSTVKGKSAYLEERPFTIAQNTIAPDIVQAINGLVPHPSTQSRIAERMCVVHDEAFSWFARFGLPVNARNKLDERSKQSQNLWYEESLPQDTLLYSILAERIDVGPVDSNDQTAARVLGTTIDWIAEQLEADPYLQLGGNETVGHGYVAMRRLDPAAIETGGAGDES